ncbi:uncharacterized protein LOC143908959 [Arctopsyche grandis]|uniref:uncharacterized protein LOC143908959 n=1 Tax=Arctopsyche grandis TaxID=121162 RepID=UPI00406D6F83
MDIKMQLLLKEHRAAIIQDVDVDDIIDSLFSSGTVAEEDFETIRSLTTRSDKVKRLLEIVSRNGTVSFQAFVDSLCKPYNWLWKRLQNANELIPVEIQRAASEDILIKGNVPKLPLYYVRRPTLEKNLHERLSKLERHKTLALHGMPGCGKTSLVISTLRSNSSLIINSFNGKVFWISVGDCKTDDQIMTLQLRLLKKMEQSESAMNVSTSSITLGSLGYSEYSVYVDHDWKDYKHKLAEMFSKDINKDSLLIIDDPREKQIVEAFDVGCKILVTTQDSTLVDSNSSILKINDSLTETESLQLISICVNQEVQQLPDQAKKMHNICRGSPLLMAMLGGLLADNKDSLKHDGKRWNHFLKQLQHKPNFIARINLRKNTHHSPQLALEMCITSLESERLVTAYKSLAVLPENIKVSAQAMGVILDMSEKTEVEDMMTKLKNKSLIIEHYNVDRKTYEYEVHDLILAHLKNFYDEDKISSLHCDLLKRYLEQNSNNLVNLPDDGYIANYIGYHISMTNNVDNMWDLFATLYTNLEFIGNKIRLAGPCDTIDDLNNYCKYIFTNASEGNTDFITKLGKFISSYGHDLHRYPSTDIIQSILQYESGGELYEMASNLVKEEHNKQHLYLQCLPNSDQEHFIVLNVGSEFNFVKFWLHYIFIGHINGNITFWTINNYKKIKTFTGHKSYIKSISINSIKPFKMTSVSNDGVLKVWDIDSFGYNDQEDNEDNEDDSTETEDDFPNICDTHNSILTFTHPSGPLCDVNWGRDSDIFLSHTNPGNVIIIYDFDKKSHKEIECEKDIEISCSILSQDDTLAIIGYNSLNKKKFGVNMYCKETKHLLITFTEYNCVLSLALLPNEHRSVLVLTNKYVKKHKWNKVLPSNSIQAKENVTHSKIAEAKDNYELRMVKIGTEDIVFVSTTDCRILLYNINTSDLLCELNNHRGVVSTMDYMEYRNVEYDVSSHLLLTASGGDQISKLWFVDETQFYLDRIRKSPKFDCVFNSHLQIFPKNMLEKVSPIREFSDLSLRRVKTLSCTKNSKPTVHKTTSLDRHTLRPLSFHNLSRSSSNDDPIVAVIDNSNSIQVFKGNKLITKTEKANSAITCIALSPCCRYLIYGLQKGDVINFTFKTLTGVVIVEIKDCVDYMEFINSTTLVIGGKRCGLMIYEILHDDTNKCCAKMLMKTYNELGSRELLDNIWGKRGKHANKPNGNNRNSYSSSESNSSVSDSLPPESPKHLSKCEHIYKHEPVIKCISIPKFGMLSIERDGSVKLWNTEPRLESVLISRQDLSLSCVSFEKSLLVMCDINGTFQIYQINSAESNTQLTARKITSQKISQKIVSCTVSSDEKILALGCESGNIVIWHISNTILLSVINFHKEPVNSMKFSPVPISTRPISFTHFDNDEDILDSDSTPLVLVSIAGQVCWWNVTSIINRKNRKLLKQSKGSNRNILSPIGNLMSSSPIDFKTTGNKNPARNSNGFNFDLTTNLEWEKLWKGKRAKNKKRRDLLNCIKLTGERAFKIMVNSDFSTFVTIDQGGVLYVMNVIHNNKTENGLKSMTENKLPLTTKTDAKEQTNIQTNQHSHASSI